VSVCFYVLRPPQLGGTARPGASKIHFPVPFFRGSRAIRSVFLCCIAVPHQGGTVDGGHPLLSYFCSAACRLSLSTSSPVFQKTLILSGVTGQEAGLRFSCCSFFTSKKVVPGPFKDTFPAGSPGQVVSSLLLQLRRRLESARSWPFRMPSGRANSSTRNRPTASLAPGLSAVRVFFLAH